MEHLQDIEWNNFEVKIARTDVPKDVWETVLHFPILQEVGLFSVCRKRKKRLKSWVGIDNPEKIENDMLTTLRSSIDKTKFTFMLDTTKAIGEESGTIVDVKDVVKE